MAPRSVLRLVASLVPRHSNLASFLKKTVPPELFRRLVFTASPKFRRFLLSTIIGFAGEAPVLHCPDNPSVTSISDVLSRFIERSVSKLFSNKDNVICFGFRKASTNAQTTFTGVENFYPNTLLEHFKNPHWMRLLEFLGDDALTCVLEKCLILVKLERMPGNTYLQICGTPISSFNRSAAGTGNLLNRVIPRYQMLYARGAKGKFAVPQTASAGAGILHSLEAAMVEKLKKCPFMSLLNHYCPLPAREEEDGFLSQDEGAMRHRKNDTRWFREGKSTLSYTNDYHQVTCFIRAVLLKCFPAQVKRSEGFLRAFLDKIGLFVRLRRFESMSLEGVVKGIPVLDCPWLYGGGMVRRDQKSFRGAHDALVRFLHWVMERVVIGLVQGFFFVTDVAEHKRRLFYFRFDVWKVITRPFLRRLTDEMFTAARPTDAPAGDSCFSKIRLMPKKTTFRPIISHGVLRDIGTVSKTALKEVHAVLMSIAAKRPELLGCSLLGTDEIADRLTAFKERMRGHPLEGAYYLVKVDVQGCFDSIPHEALMAMLLHKVLPKDDFHIGRYDLVKRMKGGAFVAWKRFASSSADFVGLTKMAARGKPAAARATRILVDQVVGRYLDREALIKALHAHILCNQVRIGKARYVQRQGIPQGSVLSSILCSLFYGDMDQRHLGRFLQDPGSLLLRFIDDTLFITTSFELASDFLQALSPGIPEYGVRVNMAKSTANFFHPLLSAKVPAGELFPWCGVLLDQQTLEARGDHCRSFGANLADSLTIQRTQRPVEAFNRQLRTFLRPWLTSVCLSLRLNSRLTVAVNLYQTFVLAAMKTHCYLKGLRQDGVAHVRPDLVIRAIAESADYAEAVVSKINGRRSTPALPVHWLACSAYHRVFARKPAAYQGGVLEYLAERAAHPPFAPVDLGLVVGSADEMMSKIVYK